MAALALVLAASAGWRSPSRPASLHSSSQADAKFIQTLPPWVNDAPARLRFAREQLEADEEAVHNLRDACPQYWSVPLEKTMMPRHAFIKIKSRRDAPLAAELVDVGVLQRLLLRPKSDAQFAQAVCDAAGDVDSDGCHAETLGDFSDFARRYRKGGLEAARAGDAAVLAALIEHGWDPRADRDRRGASELHYAAGHGHVECCALLCGGEGRGWLHVDDRASDGATPLHWAVAGVTSRRPEGGERHGFGTGGHRSTNARRLIIDGHSLSVLF